MTVFLVDLAVNIIQKSLMHNLIRILIPLMLLLSAVAQASLVVPSDETYLRWRNGETFYIYTAAAQDDLERISAFNESIRLMYEKSFAWHLDEERDLILTSSRQQIANAYATVMPNLKTVWYPSGSAMLEDMAESSWLLALVSHETAHLYQLNAKSSFGEHLHSVFGNSLVLLPFIPIFIHPNVVLPRFLLEGNAVLSESRLNFGGRLHSGEIRALALAHIKDHLITPTRLINDEFKYPFGNEAYIQGGYFEAHLAAKYGIEKTNQFYKTQAEHYINPLILNKTFRDHFGSSLPQEVREYVHDLEPLAQKQQSTPGSPAVRSVFIAPMNHDDHRIWFVSDNGIELPVLHVFDKATRQWTHETKNLLPGKVFFRGDKAETAASDQDDLHHVEYSLYGEDRTFDPEFRSQIVTDQRAGKTVSFDAHEHWVEPHILVNGENYDIGHSNPVLDEQGHVYYFRQDGLARTLYRDRDPIFKYEGFYGKIMEVTADGTIYFVANTDYGSSLYRYTNNKTIERVLVSDRVIDARRIDDQNFLVTEVESNGNSVYLAQSSPSAAQPAQYQYGFASESLIPQSVATPEEIKTQQREYNSFLQLRYSSLDWAGFFSTNDGVGTSLLASFNDPLEYNNIALGFLGSSESHTPQQALVQYTNSKYLVNWTAKYLYESERYQIGEDRMAYSQEALLGIRYPILRWRNWDSSAALSAYYSNKGSLNDPYAFGHLSGDREETYGVQPEFHLLWQKNPQLGFLPWRQFALNARNRLETLPSSWTKRYNTTLIDTDYIHGLENEFYVSGFLAASWAEGRDITVDYAPYSQTDSIHMSMLTANRAYMVQSAGSARLEVSKVYNVSGYSPRIPVGLDRLAPFAVAQGMYLREAADVPPSIFEFGYGVDLQLLLLHQIPAKIRFMQARNTRTPDSQDTQALFSTHFNF